MLLSMGSQSVGPNWKTQQQQQQQGTKIGKPHLESLCVVTKDPPCHNEDSRQSHKEMFCFVVFFNYLGSF